MNPDGLGAYGLRVFSLAGAKKPELMADIDYGGEWSTYPSISKDGIRLLLRGSRSDTSRRRLIELTDLRKPTVIENPEYESTKSIESYDPRWLPNAIPGVDGAPLDQRGVRLITRALRVVKVYDLTNSANPKLLRELPTDAGYENVRLSSTGVMVFRVNATNSPQFGINGLIVYSTDAAIFDPAILRATYQSVASDYKKCRDAPSTRCAVDPAPRLTDAGIENLLAQDVDGISNTERVSMLNDYGFWLSKSPLAKPLGLGETPKSVDVLRQVTTLSPTRGVAWLNLGDALLDAAAVSPSLETKRSFAGEASNAYDTYRELTRKNAPRAAGASQLFARKDWPNNVCGYVADVYRVNRLREISVGRGEALLIGGAKVPFSITIQGTAHVPQFFSPDGNDDQLSKVDFYGLEQLWTWDDIYIIPYEGRSYIAHVDNGRLESVIQPNFGRTCDFEEHVEPQVVVNALPAVCPTVFDSKSLPSPPPSSPVPIEDPPRHVQVNYSKFYEASVDGGPATIAEFQYSTGAGPGCDIDSVALIKDGKRELTPRSEALDFAVQEINDCRTSKSTAVLVNNEIMFQLSGVSPTSRAIKTRRLVKLKQGKVETVCRIDDIPSYMPASANP